MRVTIDVRAENGPHPQRNCKATVRISGVHEDRHGSNVVTKALVDASGHAALKIVEAIRR